MSVTYKVGDRLPVLTATLQDANGPVDVSDTSEIKLVLRRRHSEEVTLNVTAEITDGPAGKVRYAWQDDDLAKSGTFDVEWQASWTSGESMTFPNDSYGQIVVLSRLD